MTFLVKRAKLLQYCVTDKKINIKKEPKFYLSIILPDETFVVTLTSNFLIHAKIHNHLIINAISIGGICTEEKKQGT